MSQFRFPHRLTVLLQDTPLEPLMRFFDDRDRALEDYLASLSSDARDNEILFSQDGPVAVSASGRYTEKVAACELTSIFASLTTAGSTDTIFDLKKNGTAVATVTIAASANTEDHPLSPTIPLDVDDYLVVQVTQAGTSAEQLTVQVYRA